MSAAAISVVLRCLALAFAVVLSSPCHSKHPEELAPDLDQQPALPLEAFTRLPHTEHVQLSPGGDYLAFVRNDGVRSDVIVRDVETNHDAALLSTDNSRFHFNWVRWANDTRLLVSTRKYRRHKNWYSERKIIAINSDGSDQISLLSPRHGRGSIEHRSNVRDTVLDPLRFDPAHILLAADLDEPGYPSVYRVNVNTGVRNKIVKHQRPVGHWLTDQYGHVRAGFGITGTRVKVLYRRTLESDWRIAWEYDLADGEGVTPISFHNTPQLMYVTAQHQGRTALFRADMNSVPPKMTLVMASPKYDLAPHILWSPDQHRLAGIYLAGSNKNIFFDKKVAALQRKVDVELSATYNYISSLSHNNRRFIVYAANSKVPGRYYLGDRDALRMIGKTYPELDTGSLTGKIGFEYQTRDGKTIEAFITQPYGGKRRYLPTIVLPHGGPRSQDTGSFDYWAEFLASRGYVVFQPNFRGSTGYGYAFMRAGFKQWGLRMQDDLTDGVDELVERGISDPQRICILGASYGGYAALMGAVRTPELFQCAASFAGVTDLRLFLRRQRELMNQELWQLSLGDIWKDRERLTATSPAELVEQITIPVLIAHGRRDAQVNFQHARRMQSGLSRTNTGFEFLKLDRADHHLSNYSDRTVFFRKLETFFAKHLDDRGDTIH